ncbi:citrate lyase subunit alpha [Escherichia coli]|uniref:citrate lyase subunit alpha n=1 Tax=Escherichia coli TaxID=562 RepID=UPI003D80AE8E
MHQSRNTTAYQRRDDDGKRRGNRGIAVNPARPELAERLQEAGIKVVSIEWLRERARLLTGEPQPIEFTDRVVAVVRYRDGSVIDVVHQVKE